MVQNLILARFLLQFRCVYPGRIVVTHQNILHGKQFAFKQEDYNDLFKSLWFCKVGEIRFILKHKLKIDATGTEALMVQRILHFFTTGGNEILMMPYLPENVRVDTNSLSVCFEPIDLNYYILSNDKEGCAMYKGKEVRKFLKSRNKFYQYRLEANEYVKMRWQNGILTTYCEYLEKTMNVISGKGNQKNENLDFNHPSCCYIRFISYYLGNNPLRSRKQAISAWKVQQEKMASRCMSCIDRLLKM